MAGLNDLLSNTEQEQVSLPSWYTTAQQDIANQAKTAASNVPALSATPAQGAINSMMAPNNAFSQGQQAMSTIASGAANPWMQNASGQTVGDPNTAMGGLFNAQTDYLNQIMPNITAAPTAGAIGSGQFGSLRGMTAAQKARGDAFSDLAQKQMTAALQNQQTGVSAGTGLSSSGLQQAQAGTALTDLMTKYPFQGALNYGNIVNAMQVPQSKARQTQLSPLNQAGSLLSILQGSPSSGNTAATPGLISGLGSLISGVGNLFSGNSSTGGITYGDDGSYTTSGGYTPNPDEYSTGF
jgi:hypothetical protein